ncbi:DNA polymerase III subunit gamma and tau [Angustibacter luteus]|uniref:DNA polymerase III subunit gamma/tau n=1 Tax=Angustibacter luteus TaxID=658456 RepID=A0ABW1JE62_9ACTN
MSTALYRRYRPESFADVIGQEHVTEPLMQALRTGRVNHAYLFSGPRGCGKTTSARILARCLNCEQGPTDVPCGVCDSCVGLARGGAGTVDVIEIDAASHGGVDDARELREKAAFGPAASRYKVYIIDEAHMVTSAGFNALLKVVEEPPPHVKFIFATTEPEKVIGTIRSRTHHYPFRLVPPQRLQDYLAELCRREDVEVSKGVLPLVVRAGAGSVRDALSVLDQLIAGSGEDGVTYERAVSLLGYTDATLLDAVVDAFAAGDAATVFKVVDRVVESGHEPRRFVEDLLERLRDLLVISAVPEGAGAILRGVPEDQLERLRDQASRFGAAQLSRSADVVNNGLTELTGATAPRLQLELLCARVLLPAADGEAGYGARLDRIERRLSVAVPAAGAPVAAVPAAVQPAVQPAAPAAPPADRAPAAEPAPRPEPEPEAQPDAAPTPLAEPVAQPVAQPVAEPAPEPVAEPAASVAPAAPGALDVEAIRHAWPDVATRLFSMKKVTFMLVQHAQVLAFDGRRVTLGIASEGAAANFRAGAHGEFVRQALIEVLALDAQVEAVHGDTLPAGGANRGAGSGGPGRPPASGPPASPPPRQPAQQTAPAEPAGWDSPPHDDVEPAPEPEPEPAADPAPPAEPEPPRRSRREVATEQAAKFRRPEASAVALADDLPSADDPDAEDSDLVGRPVVERLLGGRVIDETDE